MPSLFQYLSGKKRCAALLLLCCALLARPSWLRAQAITSVVTDYNGYWKSSVGALNAQRPDKSHNLLAFTYNAVQYSTGVDDAKLRARGETFSAGDFWSLPVNAITGTIIANTKVGFGAMYDGVYNGASNPPPAHGIKEYLTDGIKGLNLGTCIANLPSGNMSFLLQNIQTSGIGDGIPDIVVTQIADPSTGSFDRYEFVDANGNRVGRYKDIVFTDIIPVGVWTADFYEANRNPLVLTAGFTQTNRDIRLWAADLSEFGITAANAANIRNFKISLCGVSDIAFVAYNNKSINFQQALPLSFLQFTGSRSTAGQQLVWQTTGQEGNALFVVERSSDGNSFAPIGQLKANAQPGAVATYRFNDGATLPGHLYYRIRLVAAQTTYSSTIVLGGQRGATVSVYPNPARHQAFVQHPPRLTRLRLLTAAGCLLQEAAPATQQTQTIFDLRQLSPGLYFLKWQSGSATGTEKLLVE